MSINTIIEEQKTSLLNLILEEYDLDSEQVWDWHKQSLIQILEAEIERLKGEKKEYTEETSIDNILPSKLRNHRELGYNQCLDDQITHLTNIIKEIK